MMSASVARVNVVGCPLKYVMVGATPGPVPPGAQPPAPNSVPTGHRGTPPHAFSVHEYGASSVPASDTV